MLNLPAQHHQARNGMPMLCCWFAVNPESHAPRAESPQWRRGPASKPVLCNACGTRYRRTNQLAAAPGQAKDKTRVSLRKRTATDKAAPLLDEALAVKRVCVQP
jgi:GATA zinc finger